VLCIGYNCHEDGGRKILRNLNYQSIRRFISEESRLQYLISILESLEEGWKHFPQI